MESAGLDYEIVRPRSEDLIFGTLVLVRSRDVDAVSFGFSATSPRAVELTFTPEGWPMSVSALGIHALAPTDEERAGLRDAQVAFVGQWTSGQTGAYFVAGDFNSTPWSWPVRRLLNSTDLLNSQIGFGLQPSFSADTNLLLRVPIDHLFHSPALEVTDRQLGPRLGSDHFPLIVATGGLTPPTACSPVHDVLTSTMSGGVTIRTWQIDSSRRAVVSQRWLEKTGWPSSRQRTRSSATTTCITHSARTPHSGI